MWGVIIDVAPKILEGTNSCHMYLYNSYETKEEADQVAEQINSTNYMGTATVEPLRSIFGRK